MSNGKTNRRRGFGFERELVKEAQSRQLNAVRAWGSNGKSIGCAESVDVLVEGWRLQAKRKRSLAKYLKCPEGCDAVVIREDRGPAYIILSFADWLEFLNGPDA